LEDPNEPDRSAEKHGEGWSTDGLGYLQHEITLQRVYVFHPYAKGGRSKAACRSPEARLEEAMGLAKAIEVELVGGESIVLREIKPSTFIGRGKLVEIKAKVDELELDLVVFDCELTPIQQRNLERSLQVKVIDRTALILEIFGARASTKEGELQVELAHLVYQRSRLVNSWTHLERQRGGAGFLGGPGETQIEVDRRIIADRITNIRRQLADVTKTRTLHRARRQKELNPIVALVGYTNAGKSTLFNKLSNAEVLADDMLFATLDPTLRSIMMPSGRKVLLSDTVGFISELPTTLIAAFRATLEEVLEADIIIHVRDVSHADSEIQKQDVINVLQELGVDIESVTTGTPVIEAFNKIDLVTPEKLEALTGYAKQHSECVPISGLTGIGSEDLIEKIDEILGSKDNLIDKLVPYSDGATQSWIHSNTKLLSQSHEDDGIRYKFVVDSVTWAKFCSRASR